MNYFVIGVSGVTCGGKTTLTKLLRRSFPWSRVIYQDSYFYDDDHPDHVRLGPEVGNHVNYELLQAMDMNKMQNDLRDILENRNQQPNENLSTEEETQTPNFDLGGVEMIRNIGNLEYDTSKFKHVPILIVEGFLLFELQSIFDICHVRFFLTLEEEECRQRRSLRHYTPEDCPGYFEKAIWPEYLVHYTNFIDGRTGVRSFSGSSTIQDIWKDTLQICMCRLEETFGEMQTTSPSS